METLIRLAGIVIIAGGIVGGSIWGGCAYLENRALKTAESQLQRGFPAVAMETLEDYRHSLVDEAESCVTMINTYFQARRVDKLEWVSQACLEAGQDIPEAYLGAAAAHELAGRTGDALTLLDRVAPKFDKIPDIYYRMAQILKRLERKEEAVMAYKKASERAADNQQLTLEALQYFASLERWNDAKLMAVKLKDAKTENPEVKLFIARALLKGGDQEAARKLAGEAKELVKDKPQLKTVLEKNYSDVMKL